MLNKLALFIVALLILIPTGYANSYKQHVKVCIDVENTSNYYFQFSFKSSDVFDLGYVSAFIANGQACGDLTYASGPKSIRLRLESDHENSVVINRDASCAYMVHHQPSFLMSNYLRTGRANENWVFTLKQKDNNPAQFDMICRHWAT